MNQLYFSVKRFCQAIIISSITGIGLVELASRPATAATFNCPAVGTATNCNTLLIFNQDGSVTTQILSSTPYDGADDNLVGFLNNSTNLAVSRVPLSGSNIFGFDGDGLSAYIDVRTNQLFPKFGTSGYEGPNTSFTVTNANAGFVNFTNPLQPGQGAYFTLEEAPSAGSIVIGPVIPGPAGTAIPEPFTIVGTLIGATAAYRTRKRLKATNKL